MATVFKFLQAGTIWLSSLLTVGCLFLAFFPSHSRAEGISSCAAIVEPSAASKSALDQSFTTYLPRAKPGWCSGNAYYILSAAKKLGANLTEIRVAYFYNSKSRDFRLWGTEEKLLNEFHVAIVFDGKIYDIHSTLAASNSPLPIHEYVRHMFFRDENIESTPEFLDIFRFHEIRADAYVEAFKAKGSSGVAREDLAIRTGTLLDLVRVPPVN